MKARYTSTAAALGEALRHAVLRSGPSALAALHRDAAGDETLTGDDASTQVARIRRRMDQLTPVQQALLIVSYAPRDLTCSCRRPCCAGHYANPEWAAARALLVVHTAALFPQQALHLRLREALVANLLTRTPETQVSLAARCGAHRQTVAAHTAILTAALLGTRTKGGEFDHAFGRIDALLREAAIVVDEVSEQAA
ncbi:hypothetical protein P3T23_009754 [Paraburkholderia sp. GAS448]|uniref:hypothetical protein n=1 Tax=Paraburkholderia sp. GAS448 TaxID=3035136 RepID=UPI003D1B5440